MPRPIMFDCVSSGQTRETIDSEHRCREHWYKHNKELIWNQNLGPIQGRIMAICDDKIELSRKLMDSMDEYFKFCRAPPPKKPECDQVIFRIGPDPCDECNDPATPMRTPPPEQAALLYEGISHDGRGTYGYLQDRYNCGLPETKFCHPPTTNSEYAWKLLETVRNQKSSVLPRRNTIGTFYRARGSFCETDYAPFHFPQNYY